jgi:putative oxidoreductase
MGIPSRMRQAASVGVAVAGALAFLPPLLTRLAVGQAFFFTGRGKLQNIDGVIGFFTELGIPFPAANAAFVSRLEFYGGMLLMAGLLTRVVACGLASTMVVALLTADRETFLGALRGTGDTVLADVTPVAYLLFLAWLIVYGSGRVSLDALVARWRRRAPAAVEQKAAA